MFSWDDLYMTDSRDLAILYACPFFLGPNHDVVVEPAPSCVGPDNPPKYEPTTYGAFTLHLLTLNFAHRQASSSSEDA